jgi:hypothetical protein
VLLSLILTASVLFPNLSVQALVGPMGVGGAAGALVWLMAAARKGPRRKTFDSALKDRWVMAPIDRLGRAQLTGGARIWMVVLRGYLLLAGGLVLVRLVSLALMGHG